MFVRNGNGLPRRDAPKDAGLQRMLCNRLIGSLTGTLATCSIKALGMDTPFPPLPQAASTIQAARGIRIIERTKHSLVVKLRPA